MHEEGGRGKQDGGRGAPIHTGQRGYVGRSTRVRTWEHEKLAVYRKAVAVNVIIDEIARGVPEWRYDLRDQVRRAASSIAFNLAEGASEFSPKEKARFYRMARRSAAECATAMDLIEALVSPAPETAHARAALGEIGAWTMRLIQAQPKKR